MLYPSCLLSRSCYWLFSASYSQIDRRLLLTFRSLSNELIRSLAMPNKKF